MHNAQCLIVSHWLRAPLPVAILFLLSPSSPEPVCGFWKVKADNRQVPTLAVVTAPDQWQHQAGAWPLATGHWPGNPGLAENLEWCCHLSSEYPVKWTDWISRRKLKRNVYLRQIHMRSSPEEPHLASQVVTFSLFLVTSDISPELISCANGLKF